MENGTEFTNGYRCVYQFTIGSPFAFAVAPLALNRASSVWGPSQRMNITRPTTLIFQSGPKLLLSRARAVLSPIT